jgi:hypothetical protein
MCQITANEIKQDGAAVAAAVNNIATVLASEGNTALAKQLSDAANALLAVTNNWTTGSAVAEFNDAAQAVEAVLALIPQTSALVPFIEIAVTALDILIANVGTSPAAGQPATEITPTSVKQMQARIATFPPNPYRGLVTIERHHFQSPRSAFKNKWNATVDAAPNSGIAKIQWTQWNNVIDGDSRALYLTQRDYDYVLACAQAVGLSPEAWLSACIAEHRI